MAERRHFGEAKYWVLRGPDNPAKAVYRVWGTTFDVFDGPSGDWRPATPAEMEATEALFRDGSLAAAPEPMALMAQAIIWGEAHPDEAAAIRGAARG